ncbi:MAG TPA: HEPN domain-containing protein [Nitrospiria bacterium]|nr:HEPN domain-containing protein [Nitrospiria bacterium]
MDSTTAELIRSYLSKAKEKQASSKKLLQERFFDDAVSRAYYAAFLAAQGALLSEGQRAETHKGLVTLFGLLFVKSGKIDRRFGKYLSNLKDDREAGDYEAISWIDEETARSAVREAEEFCAAVEGYLKKAGIL